MQRLKNKWRENLSNLPRLSPDSTSAPRDAHQLPPSYFFPLLSLDPKTLAPSMIRHPTTETRQLRAPPKRRGSYNCGRCGLPKKGHVCSGTGTGTAAADPSPDAAEPTSPPPPLPPRSDLRLRRALSFDDADAAEAEEEEEEVEVADGGGALPVSCLADILRRLSPKELMGAAAVCKGWRDVVKRVWISAEEVKLRVSPRSQIGFVGSVLHKCAGLARLTLTMESDADATVLACVAFSCPNLEAFEMKITSNAVNRITGDELSRFVSEKRSLTVLKIEGCNNLGSLNLYSSSLSTLWLSDLYCISKTVINCPNLKEVSLDFTRQENDSTDIVALMDCLGRACSRLRNIHVASVRLCNDAVLALAGANLRGLRMLSLVFGSKITDASVAAIVSCYASLELLDLSGSSISDSGIGMICNVFPQTLSRLLLALCPNITSSGIQFAAAQLPLLQLFDCGMSISDLSFKNESEANGLESGETEKCQKLQSAKSLPIYQKLIIKHGCLKKLSLWGCSGLDALYLNCPELNDLNLNLCTNLNPETLVIECPNLKNIHASGCPDMLIGALHNKKNNFQQLFPDTRNSSCFTQKKCITNGLFFFLTNSQVFSEFSAVGNHFPCKRLADGSKRVQVPHFLLQKPSDNEKRKKAQLTQFSVHLG